MNDPDTLWKQWKASPSPKAMSAVVGSLMPAVDRIAEGSPGISSTLMRSRGRQALTEAVKSYDPSFGASLSTHAFNHLKPLSNRGHTMLRAAPKTRYREDILSRIQSEISGAEAAGEPEPDPRELSRRLGLPLGTIENAMSGIMYELPEGGAPDAAPKRDVDLGRLEFWTEMVYNDMSPKHRVMFDMRTGRHGGPPASLREIHEATGDSQSYIHKVVSKAMGRVAAGMESSARSAAADEMEPDTPEEAADLLNVP